MSRPPIEGMTATPYGFPMLAGAWAAFIVWAARDPDIRNRFRDETGHRPDVPMAGSPIEAAIDAATERERIGLIAFCDWATVNLWGVEADAPDVTP